MKTVFDLLNARIDTDEEEVTPTSYQDVDWSAQNLVDAQQQAEIDALKLEIARLKSAAPVEAGSPVRVKNTSTFGRRFVS